MCGRFTLTVDSIDLARYFEIDEFVGERIEPSYNIAPSQNVLAIVSSNGKRKAGSIKWGLVPYWAKDKTIKPLINARAETLHEKPSFKHLARKRCLIVADSFYEWKREKKSKIPMRFLRKDKRPFAFAGLWDRYRAHDETMTTCTIVTTKPNQLVEPVHNRMPAILTKEAQEAWLNPTIQEWNELLPLLKPYSVEEMTMYEVSSIVNSPKNNTKACIQPVKSL